MKLRAFVIFSSFIFMISCGSGSSDDDSSSNSTESLSTADVELENMEANVSIDGLPNDKTRVTINFSLKADIIADNTEGDRVLLSGSDSFQVMAYGTQKQAEKYTYPSGAFEYRAEFDSNNINMPIDVWYLSDSEQRLEIARIESQSNALAHTSILENDVISIVFDTSAYPEGSFYFFAIESMKCEQGDEFSFSGEAFPASTEDFTGDAYIHPVSDFFVSSIEEHDIDLANCELSITVSYSERGLSSDNELLLWQGGGFENGFISEGQEVEFVFSNL